MLDMNCGTFGSTKSHVCMMADATRLWRTPRPHAGLSAVRHLFDSRLL